MADREGVERLTGGRVSGWNLSRAQDLTQNPPLEGGVGYHPEGRIRVVAMVRGGGSSLEFQPSRVEPAIPEFVVFEEEARVAEADEPRCIERIFASVWAEAPGADG